MKNQESLNAQKIATTNQIRSEKPKIIKTEAIPDGIIATSWNGGHVKPIGYYPVMNGEEIEEHRLTGYIKLLTPKSMSFQALKTKFSAYFVPDSRVWKSSEQWEAQQKNATETQIKTKPHIGGKTLPYLRLKDSTTADDLCCPYTDTTLFRDSYISGYMPRYLSGRELPIGEKDVGKQIMFGKDGTIMPEYNALYFRGFKAIWNDKLRNKNYDTPLKEYLDDEVSDEEWKSYFTHPKYYTNENKGLSKPSDVFMRSRMQNSYYSDYRTELIGDEDEDFDFENNLVDTTQLLATFREKISQAENAQKTPWEVMREIRGSKELTEGKVQLLGEVTIGLNYTPVTQSAYNINEDIAEEYQVLGEVGATSFTEVDIPLYIYHKFNESGTVHIIAQTSADIVFETGWDRRGLNVKAMDNYRPDLKDITQDVLYKIEEGDEFTRTITPENLKQIRGYKRKFNEYFKAPHCVGGDLTSEEYKQIDTYSGDLYTDRKVNPQKTYQFFAKNNSQILTPTIIGNQINYVVTEKDVWKDYTDIHLNENQAIKQDTEVILQQGNKGEIRVRGNNQIYMLGKQEIKTKLPIDSKIKNNFSEWGGNV